MSAIFYVLRTGCQWNALPRSLGASSTVHDRFQEWRSAGVFKRMWIDGLSAYDKKTGIDWKWQARFRRLLIRWEKKLENYVAMLHFACTCITYRAAGLFG
jgi:transposase